METYYTPESIFVGLTKLGSLIALSRIFVLFSFYHEWLFEKRLAQETKETL